MKFYFAYENKFRGEEKRAEKMRKESTLKDIISQTYVFEEKLTKYLSV